MTKMQKYEQQTHGVAVKQPTACIYTMYIDERLAQCMVVIIIIIIQHLYSAIVSYAGCRGACGAS